MSTGKRIRTMQALLEGNACIFNSPALPILKSEFSEVFAVRKIRMSKRRRLMELLHAARALDTTLKTVVNFYNCTGPSLYNKPPKAMGSYLIALNEHSVAAIGNITSTEKLHFKKKL